MRIPVLQFIELVSRTVTCPEPVVEFGSLQVEGQDGAGDLRPVFAPKAFVGCDYRPGPGVDEVRDVCASGLPEDSVGTVVLADTLEHVERPWDALIEVERVLRPGGLVVLTTVVNFPIHDYPHDYWRFTPEAIRSLLAPFTSSWVDWLGDEDFPVSLLGIGVNGELDLSGFLDQYASWRSAQQAMHDALKASGAAADQQHLLA